jgi:hypothetical protein
LTPGSTRQNHCAAVLVADAYSGLKKILVDVYGFASHRILESNPKDQKTREIAAETIAEGATHDPQIEFKVRELERALVALPQAKWRAAGVVVEGLTAHRDVAVGSVTAGESWVIIGNLRAETGDVRIGDVKADRHHWGEEHLWGDSCLRETTIARPL